MEKILVSACLLGDNCKYNGKNNYTKEIEEIKQYYEIIPICPETMGGLSIPRLKSERKGNRVINEKGQDITKYFVKGADQVLNIVKFLHIKKALLKENSPSCGVKHIYDGTFSNKLVDFQGFTSELLIKAGVECFTEENIKDLIPNKK